MNKLCILAKNKKTYFINRLIEELGNSVLLFDPWSDLELPEADTYLVRTTGVYNSDLDLLMLQGLGEARVINSLDTLKRFRSKISQYLWLEEMNFSILPWVSFKDSDLMTLEKFAVLYPEMVMKPNIGQGGWGIEVVKREELKRLFKKEDKDYLLQPLISGATELRYFFLKGCPPIVLKRSAKSGVAANFKNGGDAEVSELPLQFIPEVERLISLSGAFYGAIDLFIDHGKLYFLELNTVPGIEQLESIGKINIMKVIISSLAD